MNWMARVTPSDFWFRHGPFALERARPTLLLTITSSTSPRKAQRPFSRPRSRRQDKSSKHACSRSGSPAHSTSRTTLASVAASFGCAVRRCPELPRLAPELPLLELRVFGERPCSGVSFHVQAENTHLLRLEPIQQVR